MHRQAETKKKAKRKTSDSEHSSQCRASRDKLMSVAGKDMVTLTEAVGDNFVD